MTSCRVGLAKGKDKNASLNVPEHSKGCVGGHACQSQAHVWRLKCMHVNHSYVYATTHVWKPEANKGVSSSDGAEVLRLAQAP